MRYIVLIILNVPVIIMALLNIITQYKLRRISKQRFHKQLLLWVAILAVLIGSFPIYNLFTGRPIIDSIDLSIFDIVQTTAIIFLFYVSNNQRRKIEQTDNRLRDLHQQLSIMLSKQSD